MSEMQVDHAFVCDACSSRWYYTRERCPDCQSTVVRTYQLETGRVLATTTVHVTPPDVRSPNHLALVRFNEGVTIIAQVQEEDISAGDKVEFGETAVLRDNVAATIGPHLVTE